MSYERVLPRDLFNEAKLLKCIGKIALLIENNTINGLLMDDSEVSNNGFVVYQDQSDGSIFVSNLKFCDQQDNQVHFYTTLNSKNNWPLVMYYQGEEYYPLNEQGEYQLAHDLFTSEAGHIGGFYSAVTKE